MVATNVNFSVLDSAVPEFFQLPQITHEHRLLSQNFDDQGAERVRGGTGETCRSPRSLQGGEVMSAHQTIRSQVAVLRTESWLN
jgi:hypothetical protein